MQKNKNFNFLASEQRENIKQQVFDNCNGVTIINQGNGGAYVNNVYLNPSPLNVLLTDRFAGESVSIGGNEGEVFKGRLDISFVPGQTSPLLVIIQKYYLPD